jgi:ubiquitin C-terminal hydrolase
LNAALQGLLYTPPLTNFILGAFSGDALREWIAQSHEGSPGSAVSPQQRLAIEYVALVHEYWGAAGTTSVDTRGVWTAMGDTHAPFMDNVPHDAHEALVYLLKAIAEIRVPQAGTAKEAMPSLTSTLFDTHLEIETTQPPTVGAAGPKAKMYRSVTREQCTVLSLEATHGSLAQALADYFAPVHVPDYKVDESGTHGVTVTNRIVHAPTVLVVHLKRFAPDGSKIDRFIDYSTVMELPLCASEATYDLCAACFHRGNVHGGHYIASCRVGERWYALDDDTSREIRDINAVVHRDAYILFFQKRE